MHVWKQMIASSKSNFTRLHRGANKQKLKTQVWILQEKIDIVVVFIVFIIRCVLQMCSQYTVHSESPTASAVDSFTYTDTHPQASYHRIPTHRYFSVIYYVTSAKICDSWHSHPLHTLWCRHTQTLLLLWIHKCWRERGVSVNSHQNSHDAQQTAKWLFCVFQMALPTTEGWSFQMSR